MHKHDTSAGFCSSMAHDHRWIHVMYNRSSDSAQRRLVGSKQVCVRSPASCPGSGKLSGKQYLYMHQTQTKKTATCSEVYSHSLDIYTGIV